MALLEDIVSFCKKELDIPDEILVSVSVEDLTEDSVKGWTIDSAEDDDYDIEIDFSLSVSEVMRWSTSSNYTKIESLMKMKLTRRKSYYIISI